MLYSSLSHHGSACKWVPMLSTQCGIFCCLHNNLQHLLRNKIKKYASDKIKIYASPQGRIRCQIRGGLLASGDEASIRVAILLTL